MTLLDLFSHEWKTSLSRPAALVCLTLFVLCLFYGAVNGRIERDARLQVIANHEAEVSTARKTLQASMQRGSGSAMDVTFSSHLPPAPLADFAIGQSDLLPYAGAISLWEPDIRLFSRYELEDPVSLALGAVDLSKAIIFVLPLVLIVLCLDVLSSDRDAQRLGLALAQGARIQSIFWSRLSIRAGLILSLTFLVSFLALILQSSATSFVQRLPFFALWILSALLYGAFWIAVIGFVASKNRRGELNVILLLLAWTGFTLIIPSSAVAVAEMVYPTPSRLTALAHAREIEIGTELAESDITKRFALDHPDMLVDNASAIPAYVRTAFLVTTAVDDATRPVLATFENAAARREETLSLLRYISPAIIAHGVFNDIAGASSARHRRYMAEARSLKAAYAAQAGPYVVAGRHLPLAEAATLPVFHFEDQPLNALLRHNARVLLFLALAAGLLLFLAGRRLRHIEVVGD